MQGSLFFDGQDVQLDDIQNIETTKQNEIKRRIVDIAYQTGIIGGGYVADVRRCFGTDSYRGCAGLCHARSDCS
jgi:hypothetical protein